MHAIEKFYTGSGDQPWKVQLIADFLCWCSDTKRHPFTLIERAANQAWFEVAIGESPPLIGFLNLPGLPSVTEEQRPPSRTAVSGRAAMFVKLLESIGAEDEETAVSLLFQAFDGIESSDELLALIRQANTLAITYFMRSNPSSK